MDFIYIYNYVIYLILFYICSWYVCVCVCVYFYFHMLYIQESRLKLPFWDAHAVQGGFLKKIYIMRGKGPQGASFWSLLLCLTCDYSVSSFYKAELTAMLVNSQLLREPASLAITMSMLYCKFLVFMNWCMMSSRGEGTPNELPSVIYSVKISLKALAQCPYSSKMCAGHFLQSLTFKCTSILLSLFLVTSL